MKKPSILIVASIEDFGLLEKMLAPWYEIGVALDIAMARSWLKGNTPVLILLDAGMSNLPDGGNICQELRADGAPTQAVPIILLTAGDDACADGPQLDVSDHLVRPFAPEEVGRRVATLVSLRRSQIAEGHYREKLEDLSETLEEKNKMLEGLSSKLSKYLSPQVYESIFTGKRDVSLATERKKLTVFFSDIKDFTQTTEDIQPEDLTCLLNSYFTEMSKIALGHGATIDKFIGDAMLMFFGDPESRGAKEDAQACVRMAIAMQRKMASLECLWRSRGFEKPFRMRIGINTGYCNVGNFGSDDRMDYTIIGGEVNLAARLEGQADPGSILMSYETFALVEDTVRAEARPPLQVKGIRQEIRPYAVTGLFDDLEKENKIIRKERNGLNLLIDFEAMNEETRKAATVDLEEALAAMRMNPG
jgi:adenylate cyclase